MAQWQHSEKMRKRTLLGNIYDYRTEKHLTSGINKIKIRQRNSGKAKKIFKNESVFVSDNNKIPNKNKGIFVSSAPRLFGRKHFSHLNNAPILPKLPNTNSIASCLRLLRCARTRHEKNSAGESLFVGNLVCGRCIKLKLNKCFFFWSA